MYKESWGEKRICPICSKQYYDLGRSELECPECGKEIEVTTMSRPRRGRKPGSTNAAPLVNPIPPKPKEKDNELDIDNLDIDNNLHDKIETDKYLKIILIDIFQKNLFNYNHIDIFVKKFELTKKLFEKYNEKFIPISKNCFNLINYILLSFICLLCYKQEKNLKYLNTSLKLNDTLTNQISKNHKYLIPLEYLIKIELNFIDELIEEKILNHD